MGENVRNFGDYRDRLPSKKNEALKSGGGDGTFDDMEPRVAVLEKAVERIEKTLDRIDARLEKVSGDVSEMKGRMPSLATAEAVSSVSSSLRDKPSTWQMVVITLVLSALTVAAAIGGVAKFLPK